jgi:hypothetical protein
MPSTGKDPNSFAIHSARSLHWSIFVSDRDSSCCHRFGFGGDLIRNRSIGSRGDDPSYRSNHKAVLGSKEENERAEDG